MSRLLFFPFLGLLCAACTGNTMFHSYKSLPADGWDRRDTVCFQLAKAKEDVCGTLTIGLRTKAHVGIRDIVLAVEQCNEKSEVIRRDTLRCPLTNAEGDALSGGVNLRQYETQGLPFLMREGKSASIRIHHLMRQETMQGITELGIRLSTP